MSAEIHRQIWDSVTSPEHLAQWVPTGVVTYLFPSHLRAQLPGPDRRPRRDRAQAGFEVMAQLGITYTAEPADSHRGRQFVRSVEDVFAHSLKGTCLDLCVAYSSIALDAGLHPLILTMTQTGRRHSIVLIPLDWDWPHHAPSAIDTVTRNPFLLNGIPLSAEVVHRPEAPGGLLAIDVTLASKRGPGSRCGWAEALRSGAHILTSWDWDVCVDIGTLRTSIDPPASAYQRPQGNVLKDWYRPPSDSDGPLELVGARAGVTPFVMSRIFTDVSLWASAIPRPGQPSLAWAVVTGVGGAGKTRLAAELCEVLSQAG